MAGEDTGRRLPHLQDAPYQQVQRGHQQGVAALLACQHGDDQSSHARSYDDAADRVNKGIGMTGLAEGSAAVQQERSPGRDIGCTLGPSILPHIDGLDLPPTEPNADRDVHAVLRGQAHNRPKSRRSIPRFLVTVAEAVLAERYDGQVCRESLSSSNDVDGALQRCDVVRQCLVQMPTPKDQRLLCLFASNPAPLHTPRPSLNTLARMALGFRCRPWATRGGHLYQKSLLRL